MTAPKKQRLDDLVVARGWAASRDEAARRIMAGEVWRGTERLTRPGERYAADASLRFEPPEPWVGRGAHKLAAALDAWGVRVAGRVAVDLGASTGGFTQVLLARGARLVWAVDVGRGVLDASLRGDARVRVCEGVNARELRAEMFAEAPPSLLTADLSFISLRAVLPVALPLLVAARAASDSATAVDAADSSPAGTSRDASEATTGNSHGAPEAIVLMKPQFEARAEEVGAGGVVRDSAVHARLLADFLAWSPAPGWRAAAHLESPLRGAAGNIEYLLRYER